MNRLIITILMLLPLITVKAETIMEFEITYNAQKLDELFFFN